MIELVFGSQQLVNWPDLIQLIARLLFDLAFTTLAIRYVYRRVHTNSSFVFTYYLFNLITFFLCILLRKVSAEIGFALALFGIFGILRYRTEQIRIRDLTYLFVVIGLGVLNAIASKQVSFAELLLVNSVIVGAVAALQRKGGSGGEASTPLIYDRLDLLDPDKHAELHADLRARTGLAIVRVEIEEFDMLRDSAMLVVHHRARG